MKPQIYRQRLSEEQLSNLKASEIRDLEEQEVAITSLAVVLMFLTLVLFTLLAAMFLWLNKFTIFLFVIALPPTALFCFSYLKTAAKYKKKLKEFE